MEISNSLQKDILLFLKSNSRLMKFGESNILEMLNNLFLTREIAEYLLGILVENYESHFLSYQFSKNDRDFNREEIQNKIEEIKTQYIQIPKWNGIENYQPYTDGDYKNLSDEKLTESIKIGLKINKEWDTINDIINIRYCASNIVKSIASISQQESSGVPKNIIESLLRIKEELLSSLNKQNTDINTLQAYIDYYNHIAENIWKEYLGENKNLVHNCSKGGFDIHNMDKNYTISTTLITEKTMGLFKSPENNYFGFIIKPKKILAAESHDVFSTNNKMQNQNNFLLGKNAASIKLPWEVEQECIKKTIKNNGEILNYESENSKNRYENTVYSEVLVDGYEIERIFFISYGENQFNINYEEAKNMANQLNVPLKEINIKEVREKNGLEPMTIPMKKNLLRNILLKLFLTSEERKNYFKMNSFVSNDYETIFINVTYETFYQYFNSLKGHITEESIISILNKITSKEELENIKMYYENWKKENAQRAIITTKR